MADKTVISSLLKTAANYLDSQQYSEALIVLQSILTLDPKNEEAWYWRGVSFAQLKKYSEAIDAYNVALKINPNNSSVWNHKGVSLVALRKYSEANDAFDRALLIDPNLTVAKNNREFAQKNIVKTALSTVIILVASMVIFGILIAFAFGLIHLPINQQSSLSTLQPTQDENTKASLISQAIDYQNPVVKNFATQQVHRSSAGEYNIAQVEDVWQSIYNQWTYVSDPPNFNYYTPASDSINNGLKGNCLDYAILNAAVIKSIGGSSRVVTACAPKGDPCHAYAEVLLGTNLNHVSLANAVSGNHQTELDADTLSICSRYNCKGLYYHTNINAQGDTEYWLNLDWQANHPGGPFFKDDGIIYVYYPDGLHLMTVD